MKGSLKLRAGSHRWINPQHVTFRVPSFAGTCSSVTALIAYPDDHTEKGLPMNLTFALTPLVSLIAGILILIIPRLLNYIVAFYLIAIGLIGLLGAGNYHF